MTVRHPSRRAWFKWLLAAAFLGLEIANFMRIDSASHSVSDTLRPFIIQGFLSGVFFLTVFYLLDRARRVR